MRERERERERREKRGGKEGQFCLFRWTFPPDHFHVVDNDWAGSLSEGRIISRAGHSWWSDVSVLVDVPPPIMHDFLLCSLINDHANYIKISILFQTVFFFGSDIMDVDLNY